MEKLKFAVLGCGKIAEEMGYTVSRMPEIEAYACAARDADRARAFAERHGFSKAYGSYDEMLRDPGVDLVYIATPHSYHYEQAVLCLNSGKHVLCEKAFALNAKQAKKIIEMAREKKLLAAEAMWTRFMPIIAMANELIANGEIGEISSLTANLGFRLESPRLREPELGGGALLDVGVYPINFASAFLGPDITGVSSVAVKTDKGVDAKFGAALNYASGAVAVLHGDIDARTDGKGLIYGSKGYIEMRPINNPEYIRVYNLDGALRYERKRPEQISGYEYEVRSAAAAIAEGRLECPEMTNSETIRILRLTDRLRREWGVAYPNEDQTEL
jgi:predicted dehydrogenase